MEASDRRARVDEEISDDAASLAEKATPTDHPKETESAGETGAVNPTFAPKEDFHEENPYPPGTPSPFASPSPSDYSGPGSIYEVDPEGYSAYFEEENIWGTGEPLPPEWTHPKTVLKDGTVTELLVARSIERRVSKSGEERIVLVCPSRLPPSESLDWKESQGLFRWLWVWK